MKKVRVIFSPEAEEVYKYLNEQSPHSKTESMIFNAVNMSKIYHQSMTNGRKSNVAITYGIFSSMLKNHESHLR